MKRLEFIWVRLSQFAIVFSVLAGLAVAPARATSFVDRPFPVTVQDAPVIVRGKVGEKRTDWGMGLDGMKRIYTYYDLRVEEVFKGALPSDAVLMREMGGQKDGVAMDVAGVSQFSTGEDVVVMLGPQAQDGSYDVRGLMMGKFNIHQDSDGNEFLTGPGIGKGTGGIVHPDDLGQDDTETSRRITLQALRELIRQQATETPDSNKPTSLKASPALRASKESPVHLPALQASPLQPVSPGDIPATAGESTGAHRLLWIGSGVALALLTAWKWRAGRRVTK